MLWGLWFAAEGFPDVSNLIIFVLGTILTRSAGCAINDYADRDLDGHVARTNSRPLATGALSPKEALVAAAVLMILAFCLVLLTNQLTIMMSFVALALAVIYPFTKRITHWPQAFLGLAFAFAVPMAFAAQINEVPLIAWLIFLAAVILAIAYDTYYALADREFDIKMGMKSTAILFGNKELVIIACLQMTVLALLFVVGVMAERGLTYNLTLLVSTLFIVYQNRITQTRDPAKCIKAFLNNHYLGMTIFAGLILDYLIKPNGAA
ncbi:UNVERIFIED_CONTAM: hypothetical protein GTU68_054852 [Idotea baltica]|nr:hypothetical protein [Idotea baltica]